MIYFHDSQMSRVFLWQLYLTFLSIILLQDYPLAFASYSHNNRVERFKTVVYIREYESLSTDSLKSPKKRLLGIPYGERIYPIPGDVTIVLPKKDHKDMDMLDSRRIIGGKPIPITDFPFIVSVQQQSQHACGGSYIKDKWILTAAHCLVREMVDSPLKNPAEFTAIMGSALIEGKSNRTKNIQVRQVLMLYPHEDYTKAIALNDIGLVKIEKPFVLKTGVAYAPLPKSADDGEYREELCTVLGWGTTTDQQSSEASPILMSTQIPIIPITTCQRIYDIDRIVPLKVVCAGYDEGGKDACQGDSGGPLICHHMETGLVSWGRECGRKNQPGVYTRVDYYLEWIEQTMERYSVEQDFTILYRRILDSSSNSLYPSLLNILIFLKYAIKLIGIVKNIFTV